MMLKITVDEDRSCFEFEGSDLDMVLEGGCLIYEYLKNLKASRRSEKFVRGMLDIIVEHVYEDKDKSNE